VRQGTFYAFVLEDLCGYPTGEGVEEVDKAHHVRRAIVTVLLAPALIEALLGVDLPGIVTEKSPRS
jgi:hypothetical protein